LFFGFLLIGAAIAYPPYAVGVIVGLILIGLLWMNARRGARSTARFTVEVRPDRNSRQTPPPLLDPANVIVPNPVAPAGFPNLPPRPDNPYDRAPQQSADRAYASTRCPTCDVVLVPLPRSKKRCPSCGNDIYVRSGPDNKRHLLGAAQLAAFEQMRVENERAAALELQYRIESREREWRSRLLTAGFLVGDSETDVVGESFRHGELAGLMAALRDQPEQAEVHVVAELRREPANRHDPNAVMVIVNGVHVGYIERFEAEVWQALLQRMEKAGRRAFAHGILIGGRIQPDGMIGPIGVRLEDIPDVWHT
jgi:predicted RNA-binding Zn-ribbon protein involved in translation (DUF1610 family)